MITLNFFVFLLALVHAGAAFVARTSKEVFVMTIYSASMAISLAIVWNYTGFNLDTVYVPWLLTIALFSAVVSLIGLSKRNSGSETRKRLFRTMIVVGSFVLAGCVLYTIWSDIWAFIVSYLPSLDILSEADMVHTLWLAGSLVLIIAGFFVLLKGHLNRDNDKGMRTRNVGIGICTIGVIALIWLTIELLVALYHS